MTITEVAPSVSLPNTVPPGVAAVLLDQIREAIVEEHTEHWNLRARQTFRKTPETLAQDTGAAFGLCRALVALGAKVTGRPDSNNVDQVHEALVGDLIRSGRLVRREDDGEPVHADYEDHTARAAERAKTRLS